MKLPARVQTHEMNIQLFRATTSLVIDPEMYPLMRRINGTLEMTFEKRMIITAKRAVQSWVGSSRQLAKVARKKSSGYPVCTQAEIMMKRPVNRTSRGQSTPRRNFSESLSTRSCPERLAFWREEMTVRVHMKMIPKATEMPATSIPTKNPATIMRTPTTRKTL